MFILKSTECCLGHVSKVINPWPRSGEFWSPADAMGFDTLCAVLLFSPNPVGEGASQEPFALKVAGHPPLVFCLCLLPFSCIVGALNKLLPTLHYHWKEDHLVPGATRTTVAPFLPSFLPPSLTWPNPLAHHAVKLAKLSQTPSTPPSPSCLPASCLRHPIAGNAVALHVC